MIKQAKKTGRYEAEKTRLRKVIASEGRSQTWNWVWVIINALSGGQPDHHSHRITAMEVRHARQRLAEIQRLEREQR